MDGPIDHAALPRIEVGEPIHPDAVIPCPLKKFSVRKATACASCSEFRGLLRLSLEETFSWDKKFCILCARPVSRRVQLIGE